MRDRPFIAQAGREFSVRFTKSQEALLVEALSYLADRPGELGVRARIGKERIQLSQLVHRLRGSQGKLFSLDDLHTMYAVLLAVCHQFASEEAFHFRTGFFREQALALAEGLVTAAEDATAASQDSSASRAGGVTER
jgi:hypothetical protein